MDTRLNSREKLGLAIGSFLVLLLIVVIITISKNKSSIISNPSPIYSPGPTSGSGTGLIENPRGPFNCDHVGENVPGVYCDSNRNMTLYKCSDTNRCPPDSICGTDGRCKFNKCNANNPCPAGNFCNIYEQCEPNCNVVGVQCPPNGGNVCMANGICANLCGTTPYGQFVCGPGKQCIGSVCYNIKL